MIKNEKGLRCDKKGGKTSHAKTYKKYVDKVMKRRKLNANNLPKM